MRIEVRINISDQWRQIFMSNVLDFSRLLEAREYAVIKIQNVFCEGFYVKLSTTKEILRKEMKGG